MTFIKKILNLKSSTGILLALAAFLAIGLKNSPWQHYYDALVNFPLTFNLLELEFNTSLFMVVNDFLMAIFFLIIGLELKREILEGHLKRPKDCLLPGIAALGGLIFPALIYLFFTSDDSVALKGWAIPTATDIAFAMGVIALLGNRIPAALKICLLSLAIFDDIAAVLIIAIFYTQKISGFWLLCSVVPLFMLAALNYKQVKNVISYLVIGFFLWICILKSGIHPTISGILLACFLPLTMRVDSTSPLKKLECQLHPWVSFAILPIFAFFNAGVPIKDFSFSSLSHPIVAGIIIGLFLGKQFGVMLFSFIAIKLRICSLPINTTPMQFYGMAIITGIGFTMSLFIGSLSFVQLEYQDLMRMGVMTGSILSAVLGYAVLMYSTRRINIIFTQSTKS